MKKLIISGAGGFLGNAIIMQCLKTAEYEIYALTSQREKLNVLYNGFEKFHTTDKQKCIQENLYDGAVLVNCAFPRNANGIQMADGLRYIACLMQEAVKKDISAVVNISSQSVYSQKRELPADEITPLNLETNYAVGKYSTELLTNVICSEIPHTNLRLASLFGTLFEQRFTNKLVQQVIAGNELHITGGGQQFEFLDVRDAAMAILSLTGSDSLTWSEAYNVGNMQVHTLEQIVQIIVDKGEKLTGKKTSVVVEGESKWQNSALNCEKFMQQFAWKPEYIFEETITEMFSYYGKNNQKGNK